ncbi:hypothetical protein PIB30_030990 [Stylosanthes scabra]|uniref:PGG domain-containing protein n=1 Tax=Stylosanthes scabra TaxID=79078 RepID=A0ABU6UDN4_9FABA|nr:hypothetical protein [Stylosanthes scabra]
MENIDMLDKAANCGDINMLYDAIRQNPHVLEEVDGIPFVDTPLHSAASAGNTEFCIEIMRLKPLFGLKLNKQGFSPVHVALDKNHHSLVRCLVEINKELVRVKGREGFTPLHFLCRQSNRSDENIELLTYFLKICPDSIKDVNVRRENALHIAVRNGNLKALRIMIRWLKENTFKGAGSLERSTFGQEDSAGNTILHLATLDGNTKAIDLLKNIMRKYINVKNTEGKTALDLAEAFPAIQRTLLKAGAKHGASVRDSNLRDEVGLNVIWLGTLVGRIRSSFSEEERNLYMVIAALLITATYQTVLSPPGGLYQADNNPNNYVNATSTSISLNSTDIEEDMLDAAGTSILPVVAFSFMAYANIATFLLTFTTMLVVIPNSWLNLSLYLPRENLFEVIIIIGNGSNAVRSILTERSSFRNGYVGCSLQGTYGGRSGNRHPHK